MTTQTALNTTELESKVQAMYRDVAERPEGKYHFEMGRALAERLGYPPAELDRIPKQAIESFAGVGEYFHLAKVMPGETVVDLGSGSGMDSFLASRKAGPTGKVIGIDMTDAQRLKAERLRDGGGFANVTFLKGYIDAAPLPDASADVVTAVVTIHHWLDLEAGLGELSRVLAPTGMVLVVEMRGPARHVARALRGSGAVVERGNAWVYGLPVLVRLSARPA